MEYEHYTVKVNSHPKFPTALIYSFEEALAMVCADDPDGPRAYTLEVRWHGDGAIVSRPRVRRSGEPYKWVAAVAPCTGSVCRHRDREVVEYAYGRMLRMAAR